MLKSRLHWKLLKVFSRIIGQNSTKRLKHCLGVFFDDFVEDFCHFIRSSDIKIFCKGTTAATCILGTYVAYESVIASSSIVAKNHGGVKNTWCTSVPPKKLPSITSILATSPSPSPNYFSCDFLMLVSICKIFFISFSFC